MGAQLVQFLFITTITLLVTSCSAPHRDPGHLIYWSASNPEETQFAQERIEMWNRQHADVQIELQPVPEGQSSEEIILASVVGKTTPDIYANMWQGDVEDYALAGVLCPLDTLDGFLEFLYDRCDSLVVAEITSSDGHIYQVPWKANPIMMLYNPDLLAESGVSNLPATYAQFLEAGALVTRDKDGNGYADQWMGTTEIAAIWWQRFFNFLPLYYAASKGAPLVKDRRAAFNNEHGVAVFQFLQDVYRAGYFPREQAKSQSDPFLTGGYAVKFTGPWEIMQLTRFKDKDLRYDFMPMPVPASMHDAVYTYCDPKNIVVFGRCPDPQAAWEYIKTMISIEGDLEFLKLSQQLPRRKDLSSNIDFVDYFEKNPAMQPFQLQSRYLRGIDSSPNMKEVLDLISQEYEMCVVFGLKSPENAIKDAADAVNLLYLE